MSDKDLAKKQQKELTEEPFSVKNFLKNLGVSFHFLKDEDVVKILANKEVVDTIKKYKKYEGWSVGAFAEKIVKAAYYLRDEEAITEIARTIGKYEGYAAKEIAEMIASAYKLKDKDKVIKICKILGMDEIVNTIGKYEGYAAKEIAEMIAESAYKLKDKDEIIKISKILGIWCLRY